MEKGTRVTITSGPWAGESGTVEKVTKRTIYVIVDNPRRRAMVNPEHVQRAQIAQDFDSGLGIGGLERHTEPLIIPTANVLKRMEQEDNAQRCKRCGGTEYTTGAMFTTASSSGKCDDCFG